MTQLPRDRIIGSHLIEIGHSAYTEPDAVIEGLGHATFRSHFLRLDAGLVLDLFVSDVSVASVDAFQMTGETTGLTVDDVLGRQITHVKNDDISSPLIVLDNDLYLRDANDGYSGNPLHAGRLREDYTAKQIATFTDFWDD